MYTGVVAVAANAASLPEDLFLDLRNHGQQTGSRGIVETDAVGSVADVAAAGVGAVCIP